MTDRLHRGLPPPHNTPALTSALQPLRHTPPEASSRSASPLDYGLVELLTNKQVKL